MPRFNVYSAQIADYKTHASICILVSARDSLTLDPEPCEEGRQGSTEEERPRGEESTLVLGAVDGSVVVLIVSDPADQDPDDAGGQSGSGLEQRGQGETGLEQRGQGGTGIEQMGQGTSRPVRHLLERRLLVYQATRRPSCIDTHLA